MHPLLSHCPHCPLWFKSFHTTRADLSGSNLFTLLALSSVVQNFSHYSRCPQWFKSFHTTRAVLSGSNLFTLLALSSVVQSFHTTRAVLSGSNLFTPLAQISVVQTRLLWIRIRYLKQFGATDIDRGNEINYARGSLK